MAADGVRGAVAERSSSFDRFSEEVQRLDEVVDAADLDRDDAFPERLLAAGRDLGLLTAPLSRANGGFGLAAERSCAPRLCQLLRMVGRISLPLGRLYEGHVNAIALIERYGRPTQVERFAKDAQAGHLFGVWNTETGRGLKLDRGQLSGSKVFASGAGRVTRPLVTAQTVDKTVLMVVPSLSPMTRADLGSWQAQGMRASASGSVDFTGLVATVNEIVGGPGDYLRQPMFSGGAWRFAAVQQGGIERVYDIWRTHLKKTGRADDPHQQARLAQGAIAVETARLWVERAAGLEYDDDPRRGVAYVNMARLAVERAGLDVLEGAQRSVGLAGFMRTHDLERQSRDLATYLRQPAPDRALVTTAAFIADSLDKTADLWRHAD